MKTTSINLDVENLENTLKNSDDYVKDMLEFYDEGWNGGWEARGADDLDKFKARLKANVVNTLTYISEIIKQFHAAELKPLAAYIKLENPKSQIVLISVSLEDYLKKELLPVYSYIHSIEKTSRSENYRVAFTVTYDDGSLCTDTLAAEGFVKTHTLPEVEESAR